jgi:alkylation response protein AidB-like acyl-CoA dehydrogenase
MIARAVALRDKLRAQEFECVADRKVPEATMAMLHDAGLFRSLQPLRYGGAEMDIADFIPVAEAVSAGCGSTGWVYTVVAMHQWQIGMFPAEAQDDVWGEDRSALASSSYVPSGIAQPVDGGYRLSGKWGFASGCDGTQWMILGGRIQYGEGRDDQQVFFLVPRADYEIEDNWHVMGLAGTGSKNILIEDAFVPAHRILTITEASSGSPPGTLVNDAPLYHVPFASAISTCLCVPVLGMAQGAWDSYVEGLKTRVTRGAVGGAGNKVAELPTIQLRVAEAAAQIDAARLLLLRGARETMESVSNGEAPPAALRVRTRRDHAYAVKLCVQAIDRLFEAAGGQGLFEGNHVQRAWRDVHAASMHISTNWDAIGSLYGKFVLGLEPQGGQF